MRNWSEINPCVYAFLGGMLLMGIASIPIMYRMYLYGKACPNLSFFELLMILGK